MNYKLFDHIKQFIERHFILSLSCLCILLFLFNLQSRDFWAPDEGDFAQIVRELDNNYIVPHLNNMPYGEKPPFFYYMAHAFKNIFFFWKDEVSLRLLSGISAIIFAIFFFVTVNRFRDRLDAVSSVLFLISAPLYYWQARYLQVDMVFSTVIGSCLLCFYWYYATSRSLFYYPFFILLGIAFMTKGLLSIVLVLPVVLLFIISGKRYSLIKIRETFIGVLIMAAIILPWYIAVSMKEGLPFLYENIVRQNFIRFFDAWSHKRPFYYYLTTLPLDFFPWSLFLPLGIYAAFKSFKHDMSLRFSLIWFLWMFVFLSFSSGKISKYMLPLLPAVALMVSAAVKKEKNLYNTVAVYAVIIIFFLLGLILFFLKTNTYLEFRPERILIGAICILTSCTLLFLVKKKSIEGSCFALFLAIVVIYIIANTNVYGKINAHKTPKVISEKIRSLSAEGIPWVYYGSIRGVYVYYAGRYAIHVDEHRIDRLAALKDTHERLIVLTRKRDIGEVISALGNIAILSEDRIGDTSMVIALYKK